MSNQEAMKKRIQKLFDDQKLAVLSTHCSGQPYASLVGFTGSRDLKHIYFVTPRTTRKYRNISADSRVAMLINSSANMDADFHEAVAVTALGSGREIDGPAKDDALRIYLSKHPYLETFATSPTCAMVEVSIRTYVMVNNFQHVMELHVDP